MVRFMYYGARCTLQMHPVWKHTVYFFCFWMPRYALATERPCLRSELRVLKLYSHM